MSTARDVHRALRKLADPKRATALQRYFKCGPGEYGEGDRFLGLTLPQARQAVRQFKDLPLAEATKVLRSPWHEERLVALLILAHQYKHGTRVQQEAIFRLYLKNTGRINNWDLVDISAPQIVGAHLHDGRQVPLRRLARSRSLWERRIAALATFQDIKHGEFGHALQVAGWLRDDPHDLIHKAVGWMLREIGKRNQRVEEHFLAQHAARMPRTMLRYAIERFPEPKRRRYLAIPRARSG